jgi:CheY-like chemotaxis protein/TolB-like protein
VLIVEDESIVAHDLQQTLAGLGYDAYAVASSADQALARASEKSPDVVLVDIRIKGRMDGIEAARLLKQRFDVPVIYVTAHADDATLERAKQTRPHGYLLKPVKPAELKSAIEIAVFRHDADRAAPMAPKAEVARPTAAPARPGRPPGARAVRRQLDQILSSADFDASRRSREFLRFIVEETLAGRGEDLTQSAIATRVFGRRDDFDAVVDPIVRIQAGRLRRSLERYYLLSGKDDAVRVELPLGTYAPTFRTQAVSEPAPAEERPPEPTAAPVMGDDWPAVVISRFESTPGSDATDLAVLVTEELVRELGRYRDVRAVLQRELDQQEAPGRPRERFALVGRVRADQGDVRVTAQLVDRATGEQVWGEEYHTAPSPGRWSGSPEDIARVVAARVGAEEGVIVQLLAAERRRRKPTSITPYGAILLSYEFFMARDPDNLSATLDALRQVVKTEPECGVAWTRLARLHLANHTFEVTAIPTPIEEAITYAHHGVRVDPSSRRARSILASALLISGELGAARDELEQALRLSPDSLVYLEIIGYLLSLLGDGERGTNLIRNARQRNPYCLPHASFGLWFDHLRRGEFEPAYQAALEYRDPTFFWRCLMRACCLAHLGRRSEAEAEVAELRRRKPDFESRGRVLIGYYVKPPEMVDRIVDGLARAGMKLA